MSEPAEPAHPTPVQHPRRRRRLIVTAVTAAAAVLAALGTIAAYFLLSLDDDVPPMTYKVDQRVVKDWNQKLAPALADLNALSDISGLKPGKPDRVSSCSVDSGELFDLSAGRDWDATDPGRTLEHPPATVTPTTAHAFLQVIGRLRAAGWHVEETSDNLGMDLPPGLTYDTADLTRTTSGVKTNLTLQVFDAGLLAGLGFDGAKKACGGQLAAQAAVEPTAESATSPFSRPRPTTLAVAPAEGTRQRAPDLEGRGRAAEMHSQGTVYPPRKAEQATDASGVLSCPAGGARWARAGWVRSVARSGRRTRLLRPPRPRRR